MAEEGQEDDGDMEKEEEKIYKNKRKVLFIVSVKGGDLLMDS